jgi:hypothetical protein
VSPARTLAAAVVPLLLHVLAREADRGLGLVLRAGVEPDGLLTEVVRAAMADASGLAFRVPAGVGLGLALWCALAWGRRRREGGGFRQALAREAPVLLPLLLRPALTLLALLSVGVQAAYPYAFTLPVALTQDWGPGQDAAALATVVAMRLPRLRVPAPRPVEVFALAFLVYAALVPGWAWRWEGHPGNEPKYLRQAVALGQGLTFDAAGVSAAMEDLPVRPLVEALPAAASAIARESWAMAGALARGEAGRDSIRATRITRQTIRGKDGGVYYVLAPGPSLLLAPALRVDRALNLARGTPGRVAASVLLWCALAALLVMALYQLVRDATGRPGLAAVLALGFALVPPFLFYPFQFYPEMVGALVLAVAFRTLALRPEGLAGHPWLFGLMLATLPWLHQKFLPVWLVLVATAVRSSRGTAEGRVPRDQRWWIPFAWASRNRAQGFAYGTSRALLLGVPIPTAASLYLTALYNFAITGSVRPDALFLAWGPGGVTSARVGQGILGLLLDARYGILPYVPILLLATGGLVLGGARRFAVVLPAAAVYYLTVASADNWAGAVCNLGRYFMPVAPLAVALVGLALRVPTRAERGSIWADDVPFASGRGGRAVLEGPGEGRSLAGASAASGALESAGPTDSSRPAPAKAPGTAGAETADPSSPDPDGAPRDDGTGRGVVALALILAAWTGLFAVALWQDPHAANDSALLLAKSAYADGNRYIPNLFIRQWSDGAPGLWARIAAWLAALAGAAFWLRRAATAGSGRGRSPLATLAAVAAVVLAAALLLERWPGTRTAPAFPRALALAPASLETTPPLLFIEGTARVREGEAIVGPGAVDLLVRAGSPVPRLKATVGGTAGVLRVPGLPPVLLRPTGASLDLPLVPYHEVRGREGRRAVYSRASLALDGEAVLRPVAQGEMEPEVGRNR